MTAKSVSNGKKSTPRHQAAMGHAAVCGVKAKSKNCVSRCFLKVALEGAERTDSGRLLHAEGAQKWNALALFRFYHRFRSFLNSEKRIMQESSYMKIWKKRKDPVHGCMMWFHLCTEWHDAAFHNITAMQPSTRTELSPSNWLGWQRHWCWLLWYWLRS